MDSQELEIKRLTECLAVRDLRIITLIIDLGSCDHQVQKHKDHEQIAGSDHELLGLADVLCQSDQIQKLIDAIADKEQQINDLVFSLSTAK